MKTQEIRELMTDELGVKMDQLTRQLAEMKMQFCNNPGSVKMSEFGKMRKTIARLLTVQRERALNITRVKAVEGEKENVSLKKKGWKT